MSRVSASHNLQLSGLISSPRTMLPSASLPNSILKSTRMIPASLNIALMISLILSASSLISSSSSLLAIPRAIAIASFNVGSWNSSDLKSICMSGGLNGAFSSNGNLRTMLPVAMFLTITSIGIISSFWAFMTHGSTSSINWVFTPASSRVSNIFDEMIELKYPFCPMLSFLAPSPAVMSSRNFTMTSFSLSPW